ncbi:MAG TPA: DoxX family protein [Ktedonobacteraceae bacterium]|jgi:putative oxidoreductase|nr:DoxX family protein [Ktedonobacteraceae bacterium]
MKMNMLQKQTMPTNIRDLVLFKQKKQDRMLRDLGLLTLRLSVGGLLVGHGSQKMFGWFKGPGLQGTAGWLESLGLKPGTAWATAASASELGGGLLTTLGFLHPIGPIGTMGAMIMATVKAHWGKPIWVSQGGAELPVTNMAAALALTLTGPGRFSLDNVLGIRLPRALIIAVAVIEAMMVAIGIMSRPTPAPETAKKEEPTPAQATSPEQTTV